jgi:hypothetical protein
MHEGHYHILLRVPLCMLQRVALPPQELPVLQRLPRKISADLGDRHVGRNMLHFDLLRARGLAAVAFLKLADVQLSDRSRKLVLFLRRHRQTSSMDQSSFLPIVVRSQRCGAVVGRSDVLTGSQGWGGGGLGACTGG